MLTKNQIKEIASLAKKKFRDRLNLFPAEGSKLVSELLEAGMEASSLVYTSWWDHPMKEKYIEMANQSIQTDENQIKKISNLKTPPPVVGIFRIPNNTIDEQQVSKNLSLVLDDVQDPGNLGTIIRIADWFGIENIFCSPNTVDLFNPKVIQATMGALSRVKVHYTPLTELIEKFQCEDFPVYGTFLEGEIIYKTSLSSQGFIIMGNEGQGISPELKELINKKLFIPNYPLGSSTSESLNVSVATSIICSEFRRRLL